MRPLLQFLIILAFYSLGELIAYLLPFSFSGAIIGMVLLFISLYTKLVKLEMIQEVSHFFLKYMPLFFIPAGVSVMNSFGLIKTELIAIISALILSTLFMLMFISLVVDYLIKKVEPDEWVTL